MTTNPRAAPIERATNRSWDEWLTFMDGVGAKNLSHKDIAQKVYEELDGTMESAGWWAQSVTVAYQHHIGRRISGQRSDGTFQLSVSRSTTLGLEELMARWSEFASASESVKELLAEPPRISGTDRRITWRAKAADGSSIVVTSESKKNGSASVVAMQMGLPTPEANDAAREHWVGLLADFLKQL